VSVTATGADNVGVTSMTLNIDGATVATSASGTVGYSWNTSGLTAGFIAHDHRDVVRRLRQPSARSRRRR